MEMDKERDKGKQCRLRMKMNHDGFTRGEDIHVLDMKKGTPAWVTILTILTTLGCGIMSD